MPISERLVHDLAAGYLTSSATASSSSAPATHIWPSRSRAAAFRAGKQGRFFSTLDLVTRLGAEKRGGRQERLSDDHTHLDFDVLDEFDYLPFAQSGGQLLFHLVSRL